MSAARQIDLTNFAGERIGCLVRLGSAWQAFTVCPASDALKYIATYSDKASAREAIRSVAHRAG